MLLKIRRIKALMVKEFYQIIHDPSSILIAVIFPILLLFIYGFGVSLDMDNLPIGLVLEDSGSDAQSFALSLRNSKFFSVELSRNQPELEKKITGGSLKGLVVVPFYFSQYKRRPDIKGPIYVVADGSSPNTANFVQNYVEGAWKNWINQEIISNGLQTPPQITPEPRFWYNEELNSRYFLIPGSIAIIMTLIGTLLTALVIAREWERGTIEALMATPITIREFIFSKMICYFLMGIASLTLCTVLAVAIYGIPYRGTLTALFIVSSVFLFAALATGLLISSMARNQFVACQIATITAFLPAFMLSGFIFEISSMPFLIQLLTYIFPARYMVSSLQTLFLVGDVWKLLTINIAAMLTIAFVLFIIIAFKTVKRLD